MEPYCKQITNKRDSESILVMLSAHETLKNLPEWHEEHPMLIVQINSLLKHNII